jgi:hypothetical protein
LHVAGEDDETAFVLADERDLFLFRFPLVFFRDRYDEVGDAVEVGDTLVIGMVGNDQRDFAAQFAALVAVEKVLQAVVKLRDEDGDAGAVGGVGESLGHLEVVGDGSKALGKLGKVKIKICRIELDARKKEIGFLVSMLIGEEDVAVVAKDEFGDRGNDAFAVGAGDEKDGGVVHRKLLIQSVSPVGLCALCGSQSSLPRRTPGATEEKLTQCRDYFFSAFAISRAALAPEPPVSPVPGCVPLPHKYRLSIGVL